MTAVASHVDEWAGPGWKVTTEGDTVQIESDGALHTVSASTGSPLEVYRSFLGLGPAYLSFGDPSSPLKLKRIGRRRGRALKHRLGALSLFTVLDWGVQLDALIETGLADQRWITRERRDEIKGAKPTATITRQDRRALPEEAARAEALLDIDVDELVAGTNERIVTLELSTRRDFLDTIERQPLTDEQARAVLEYDNRVQVVAAAGSGKTSVMVARAAYAIDRGFTSPEGVLLLAFNRAAAKELQKRVDARFDAAGIPARGVRASTFHSLGLSAIGHATGEKPRVAPWMNSSGEEARKLSEIVDRLRDESTDFRYKWDLYRLIYSRTPIEGPDAGTPDGYDGQRKVTGYETLDRKVVKSFGEKMIADWLFLNGIEYEYERPYEHDTATATQSQYHPDFYYPAIDTWHEHWALDRDGEPPEDFDGYSRSMEWRIETHSLHGTDLIETTWHEIVNERLFGRLEAELTSRGIELDWDPNRIPEPRKAMSHDALERLMRTFMTHIKSNSLTRANLEQRLLGSKLLSGARTQLFLDLYWPIHESWNAELEAGRYVDFEDMLVKAAEHLLNGDIDLGYDLILADEFQDASQARVRLVQGLLNQPHRHLLAVGDDWQSINRFAGADISAMTDFDEWFGSSSQLDMTRTFRFPQDLADVSSRFVMRNPRQIRKKVRSASSTVPMGAQTVHIVYEEPSSETVGEILAGLSRMAAEAGNSRSVFILGRYRFDEQLVPERTPSNLDVRFSTVHGSKGLEADFVVVPNMDVGTYGFPSGVEDDPILQLAMTDPDGFPAAEERRLFYVALTRARIGVTLVTRGDRPSPFVVELVREFTENLPDGPLYPCKVCGQGTMVEREGQFGVFYGCSRFPACGATANTPDGEPRVKNDRRKSARPCVECGQGTMVKRTGRFGDFYGCSRYPTCDATEPVY